MGINAAKVYIGLADQSSTTGALKRGAVITTVPTTYDAAVTAISSFTSGGYVSEDGATLTTTKSVTTIKEWNKKNVRRLLEDFDGTISLTLIQLDEEGAKQCFGASNVSKVAANTTHGEQLHIDMNASLDEPQAWALCMKDGDAKFIVLIPNGQVTSGVDITFVANEAINLPITISANDGGIQLYTDDGKKTS